LTLPTGYSQLAVSHISYKTQTKKLSYLKSGNHKQTIRLKATEIELEEITVSAKSEKKWRKKLKGVLTDELNGQSLVVKFDKTSQSAQIFNDLGEELPTITLYWFAWYALHPDTKIFK